jgi:TRAP-type mannitol/chloroaromatic compound transport system substrate-binding protein
MDGNMMLAWHHTAARNCCQDLQFHWGERRVPPCGPHPTQPLGWFKKAITSVAQFKGLKYRTVGISIDLFTAMGAAVNALPGGEIVPAMDRELLEAAGNQQCHFRPHTRLPRRLQGMHNDFPRTEQFSHLQQTK